ncbi:trypsin-like [Mytilus galloprovincialis]|uniref:trypsin-like n=1 Tax=Mytilus galloprovincialis TaxID=29158 RepID=UPI003F7B886B
MININSKCLCIFFLFLGAVTDIAYSKRHSSKEHNFGNGNGHGYGHGHSHTQFGQGQGHNQNQDNKGHNSNGYGHGHINGHKVSNLGHLLNSYNVPLNHNLPNHQTTKQSITTDRHLHQQNTNHFESWKSNWWNAHSEICGKQEVEPRFSLSRIIGGREAIKGSWPWMISLFNNLLRQPTCAAVLISEQWALTAGHCFSRMFDNETFITARVGLHNASAFAEDPNEQAFKIIKVLKHQGIEASTVPFNNDIALLKLDRTVTYNSAVRPVCLPDNANIDQTVCAISGWGRYKEPKKTPDPDAWPQMLQQTRVPILPQEICMSNYKNKVTDNMFCAGYEQGGVDACQGDSGGPLQCQEDGRWCLRGIISWGGITYTECAQPLQPGVYTKVYNYVDWILQNIFENT